MARLLVLMACVACAAPPAGPSQADPATPVGDRASVPSGDGDSTKPEPSGPIMSEAHARERVTSRLREAGLRVLFDVEVEVGGRTITLDGFDPKRGIGFEYSAPSEASSNGKKPTSADGPTILWLEASDQRALDNALAEFIRAHLSPDAGPS